MKKLLEEIKERLSEIEDLVKDPQLGSFEEITDEDKELLEDGFDVFFETLKKNFKLTEYSVFELEDVKNLCRHTWNYKK